MVTACLSWYEESPTWLAATITSCARFCDRIIAVDGAYALYPGARASSGAEQHEAIVKTAEAAGMAVTVHVPREPWAGNEVEKRDFLMRSAVMGGDGSDWLLVIDADEVVIGAPPKDVILAELAATDCHVATVTLGIRHDHYEWMASSPAFASDAEHVLPDSGAPPFAGNAIRRIFRAHPSFRVEQAHYLYRIDDEDGQTIDLWDVRGAAPAIDLHGVVMEHRNRFRDPHRRNGAKSYYRIREAAGIEARPQEVGAA